MGVQLGARYLVRGLSDLWVVLDHRLSKGPSFTHEAYFRLRDDWWPPDFLPKKGYVFPFTLFSGEGPLERFFYDWGVYVAPAGAVTRLHVDGTTNAVLMLVSGIKEIVLVPPQAASWFINAESAPKDEPLFEEQWAALSEAEQKRVGFKPIR